MDDRRFGGCLVTRRISCRTTVGFVVGGHSNSDGLNRRRAYDVGGFVSARTQNEAEQKENEISKAAGIGISHLSDLIGSRKRRRY